MSARYLHVERRENGEMDEWDAIVELESRSIEAGRNAGAKAAAAKSQIEGDCIGWRKGGEMGAEVGFYLVSAAATECAVTCLACADYRGVQGFCSSCDAWLALQPPDVVTPRARKTLESLRLLAGNFPRDRATVKLRGSVGAALSVAHGRGG
eukprot:SAG11_NODE_3840_length_2194_cov_1.853461_2_plen_152_part_00